jgi:phosphomannomutase
VLPDPDEPLVHIYAEAETRDESTALEEELRRLVEGIMHEQESGAAAQISS